MNTNNTVTLYIDLANGRQLVVAVASVEAAILAARSAKHAQLDISAAYYALGENGGIHFIALNPPPAPLPAFQHHAHYKSTADMAAAAAAAGFTRTPGGKYFIKPASPECCYQQQYSFSPVYPEKGGTLYQVYGCSGYSIPAGH